jgi:hypothetical protein
MRFGIMATQLKGLIPEGSSPQQVLTHLGTVNQTDLNRRLFDPGFDPIELDGDLAYLLPSTFAFSAIDR